MASGRIKAVPFAAMVVLAVASVITLIPYVWLACSSFKDNQHFFDSLFIPFDENGLALSHLTVGHFRKLFVELDFGRSLVLSVFYASVTGLLATLFSAMGGYALARLPFKGSKMLTMLVLGAVLVPPPLLLAPGYELLYRLGLLDTLSAMILPATAPAMGIYLFRQATISAIPPDLLEAARVDGSGELRTFFTIALPLLRPMFGTFLMITILGVWNNFITPQVVLKDPSKFPVSVAVAELRGLYYQDYGLQMAGTLVAILPLLLLFAFMQREFIQGLTSGAVKA